MHDFISFCSQALGILYTPLERSGHQSWNVALRQGLDIYASVILIKNIPGYRTRHSNVDFAIIRVPSYLASSAHHHRKIPKENIPAWSINLFQESSKLSKLSLEQNLNELLALHSTLPRKTTARKSLASIKQTS